MSRGFLSDRDREVRKGDLVDLRLRTLGESDKAWKVTDDDQTFWLPKSQVERDGDTYTLPEWLATEKGLI